MSDPNAHPHTGQLTPTEGQPRPRYDVFYQGARIYVAELMGETSGDDGSKDIVTRGMQDFAKAVLEASRVGIADDTIIALVGIASEHPAKYNEETGSYRPPTSN